MPTIDEDARIRNLTPAEVVRGFRALKASYIAERRNTDSLSNSDADTSTAAFPRFGDHWRRQMGPRDSHGAETAERGRMTTRYDVCIINIDRNELGREGEPSWYGWITRLSDTVEGELRLLSIPGEELRPSAHTQQQLLKRLNHIARELGFKYGQVRDYSSKTPAFDVLGVVTL